MKLTKVLLEEINKSDGYIMTNNGNKGVLLVPNEETRYYMPDIFIRDLKELETVLEYYIDLIITEPKLFYKIDERHKIKNYLFYLVKSLTNTDCQDFIEYIKRFTMYLKDSNFNQLDYSLLLGEISNYKVYARMCEEYYGSETPYTMHYYTEIPGFKFEMPLVRYGISNENVAYIYSIQRKRLYNNNNCRIKSINSIFNGVNSGVKEDRDITPSMLCSLVIFIGMLHINNITKIKADGFLTRRYGHFDGITTDEERNSVSHHSVDKFFKLFLRVAKQFDGIDITAYPFDIDSYMHLSISNDVHSKNELLNHLYNIGLNYSPEKTKQLSRKL